MIHKSLVIMCMMMALFGCTSTRTNINIEVARADEPRVYNLAPAFIAFWKSVEAKPIDEKLPTLKNDFFTKFPQFYEYSIDEWKKAGINPDERLKKQLTEFPQIKDEFITKTNEITINLESTLSSFSASLPGLDRNFDIYITHSFGSMDGGIRKIGGIDYFILGIDGMVKYHRGLSSEIPFFHHELFHVYHSQYFAVEGVFWAGLWAEGLAVYASQLLNPNTPMKNLMLNIPEGTVKRIDEDIDFYWNDLKSRMRSTKEEDYETYFLMSSKEKSVTTRAGYYLGYLLAKEIGTTKTLIEMAQMDAEKILPLLERTIETVSSMKK